jgi:large subunit ribosomal protein L9
MEVILQEHIENLGKMGDIVKVAPGFARNYLIPKKKAAIADRSSKKALEHQLKVVEVKKMKVLATLEDMAKKIESLSLTIPKKVGENDKLFGSVTTIEIADALKAEGVNVLREQLKIEEPIRSKGVFNIVVRLAETVKPTLKLWVVEE